MADVFISYSRKDKAFVQKLHNALIADNRETWVDWEGIELTEDWWAAIQDGIEKANTFAFVISPDSVTSTVCKQEIDHAVAHNKRLVPIFYREVPTSDVPESLTHLNWVFFRESDNFENAFRELVRIIDTDLNWVKAHTRLTVRAVEWDKQGRNDSFLLRGVDLKDAKERLTQTNKIPKLTDLQVQYILASEAAAIRRQRMILGSLALGLLLAVLLCALAFLSYQVSQREARQRALAEEQAQSEAAARSTAVAIQATAEAQAGVAAQKARSAQEAAYQAEIAEATAVVAEATALAARQDAENNREVALHSQQTAEAARNVAQTQQAQAVVDKGAAEAAQATALAAEDEARLAQQTAIAGQATALANQATAEAQQAEAQAAAQAAQAAAAEAQAAVQAAENAKEEAEKAKREAQRAKEEAERAKQTAEAERASALATLQAVEEERKQSEEDLARVLEETKRANFAAKYSDYCDTLSAADPAVNWSEATFDGTYFWAIGQRYDINTVTVIYKVNADNCSAAQKVVEISGDFWWNSISYGQDHIWVVLNDPNSGGTSEVRKLDATGAMVASWSLAALRVQYANGFVWLIDITGEEKVAIQKVDPNNGTVLATYNTGIAAASWIDWSYAQGTLWLFDVGGMAHKFDLTGGAISEQRRLEPIAPSISQSGAAYLFDGQDFWVVATASFGDNAAKIDGSGRLKLAEIPYGSASFAVDLIYDGSNLWGFESDGYFYTMPISPSFVGGKPGPLAEAGAHIWVGNGTDLSLSQVLASSGEQVSKFTLGLTGQFYIPEQLSLLTIGANVWSGYSYTDGATFEDTASVSKVQTSDGQVLATYTVNAANPGDFIKPRGLAYDGSGLVWVVDRNPPKLLRLSEATGQRVDTLTVTGGYPWDIVWDGANRMWLLVNSDYEDEYSFANKNDVIVQQLNTDGSVAKSYTLTGKAATSFAYRDNRLWLGYIDYNDSSSIYSEATKLLQLQTTDGATVSETTLDSGFGLPQDVLHDGTWVWLNDDYGDVYRVSGTNPATSETVLATCKAKNFVYHSASQSVWASCPSDNAIQKLSGATSPPTLIKPASSAPPPVVLGDDALRFYLPLVVKY